MLKAHNLDAIVLPAPWPGFTTTPAGAVFQFFIPVAHYLSQFKAIAGYPIVTGKNTHISHSRLLTKVRSVPLGFYPDNVTIRAAGPLTVYPAPGVPIGLSFLGTAFSDFSLIGFAFAYEQKTRTRLARKAVPEAIPTTQLKDVVGKA